MELDDQNANNTEPMMIDDWQKLKEKYHRQKLECLKRNYKCFSCPDEAPARGQIFDPYHSRASLLLHKLWKHKLHEQTKSPSLSDDEDDDGDDDDDDVDMNLGENSLILKATLLNQNWFDYRR